MEKIETMTRIRNGTSPTSDFTESNRSVDDDEIIRALFDNWIIPQLVREYLSPGSSNSAQEGHDNHRR